MAKPSVFNSMKKAASDIKQSYLLLVGKGGGGRMELPVSDVFKKMQAAQGAKGVAKLLGKYTGLFTPAALLYLPIFFAERSVHHSNNDKRDHEVNEMMMNYNVSKSGAQWIVDVLVYGNESKNVFSDDDQPGLERFLEDVYEATGETPLVNLP
jgi:hypothetical protein